MVVLHGLWSRRQALCLWVEHEGVPAAAADEGGRESALHPGVRPAPPPVLELLRSQAPLLAAALAARTRSTVELSLPTSMSTATSTTTSTSTERAARQRWRVPVVVLNPDRAEAVLAEVSELAQDAGPTGAGVLGGAGARVVEVGDDLLFLADVAAAVRARAGAGAVVPTLVEEEGAWWGRWLPLPDAEWERWRTGAAAAMPPVLRAEVGERGAGAAVGARTGAGPARAGTAVLDAFCGELTDLLVGRVVAAVTGPEADPEADAGADLVPGTGPGPQASLATAAPALTPVTGWVEALLAGAPVPGRAPVLADLATRVRRWHAGASPAPVELLLRIAEPPQVELDPGSGEAAEGGEASGWTLQVRLRSLDDPSLVLTPEQARAGVGGLEWTLEQDPWAFALTELGRAAAIHPPLLAAASGQVPGSGGGGEVGLDTPIPVDAVLDLVATGVPALLAAGIAVQLPGRWLRPAMSLTLHAETRAAPLEGRPVPAEANAPGGVGRDALVDYSWKVALGDQELGEDELAQLVAAKSPLVKLRGQWVQVDADRIARSLRFLQRAGSGRASLGGVFSQLAGAHLPEPVSDVSASGWLGDLLAGRAERTITPVPVPAALDAELRPYQQRGLSWLVFMARLGLGVVLADDMGLGKTVQLLALLLSEREHDEPSSTAGPSSPRGHGPGDAHPAPTLLVAPMSVVGNWQREAARFAPGLRVHVHHGPQRLHAADLTDAVAGADLVITTYALLVRDATELAALSWHRVALDEAQHVKNAGTRAARAARAVAAGSPPPGGTHRVALTGTPVENRLAELHSILDFTNPGLLGSPAAFRERFAVPVERHRDRAATALLTTMTRPFVLRRLKTDKAVIADLPDKLEMVVRANLTAEQASLYQAVVDDVIERIAASDGVQRRGLVLAALTRLKQVCNHPAQFLGDGSPVLRRGQHRSGKLALVDDVLDAVVADGERALCFTQYRELGDLLAPHLAQRYSTDVPFLHGGVPKGARDAMVERFSGPGGPPVMLLSLRAGGTGINLTAANHVIHLDRWWNPAVEDQATDRAYRIGQQRQVQVRKLVCVGTVEERVDALMTTKRELADLAVGTGEGWLTELSTDALRELFVLGADAVGD